MLNYSPSRMPAGGIFHRIYSLHTPVRSSVRPSVLFSSFRGQSGFYRYHLSFFPFPSYASIGRPPRRRSAEETKEGRKEGRRH